MRDLQSLWWDSVPNALRMRRTVSDMLIKEESLVLSTAGCLPWKNLFYRSVTADVNERVATKAFITVNGREDPEKYLMEHCCDTETRAMYRPSKSVPVFLAGAEKAVIHSRYIWVDCHTVSDLYAWSSFAGVYGRSRKRGKGKAVFILCYDGTAQARGKRRPDLPVITLADYITDFDRNVFASLVVSSLRISPAQKQYLTELAVCTVGHSMELCAGCLNRDTAFLSDPYKTAVETADEEGLQGCISDSAAGRKEFKREVWKAQVRTFYPAIEEYRQAFAERHEKEIDKLLPFQGPNGDIFERAADVEVGVLYFFYTSGRLALPEEEGLRLTAMRDARNALSHNSVLQYSELKLFWP